ncbi:Serine/threonine-protein kinase wnk4 [Perkinsus olseni]|uniref:Serine/threonine-protein kinase wnk4 n=1 Tax=Perkinsus olseni TaxID=32597 RepID=A0A7J6PAT3_PEROL|nr:Serine/threonine-protein kinase wnk4 [Perkinsus olseni]
MPTKTLKEHETTSEDEKRGSAAGDGDDGFSDDPSSASSGSSSDSSSSSVPHGGGGRYINRLDGPLKVKVIRMWCKQILEGINYLHNQLKVPVIHRDLKCDNIFINGSDGKVLIGDLGLSTALQHASVATSIVGTPEFMAPELYEEKYGPPVDIYAFGMCLLEMVTRKFPYAECTTPGQIYKKVINGEMPESLERIKNKELKRIIEQCIEKDPAKRPTAAELLAMPCWDQKDDGDELATLEPLPSKEGDNDAAEESPSKEKGHRQRKTRGQSDSVKSTPARVGQQQKPRTPSEGSEEDMVTISNRAPSAPTALQSEAGGGQQALPPPAVGVADHSSDSSEAPQLISATTHIEAASSPNLTGGEAVIRRDVAKRPPNEKVMAAVAAHDGTVHLPPEIEDFCRNQLGSDRVTKVVLLIETETDKFQRINFEYNLDEDTCDSIAEELLENNLVWREVNRDRLVQKIRQAVFVRVKQIALEEGIPLPPPVAAAIAGSTTAASTTAVTKQPGETAPSPAAIKVEEGPAPKAVDSPPSLGRASTPPGTTTTEESIPTTQNAVIDQEGRPAGSTCGSHCCCGGAKVGEGERPSCWATGHQSPDVRGGRGYGAYLYSDDYCFGSCCGLGLPRPAPPAPSAVESAETTVEAPEAAPVGGAHAVATRPQVSAAPVTPGNAAALPSGIVSPSNHAVGTGKPPPAPRSTPHAAMVGASGRHSHLPSGDVPSMSGISGATKLGKKASMSKYVPLTPESTAQLTNDTVSGVGLEQVVPHFYKDVLNAEYGDSGQSGALIRQPVAIPPPLNDGHAPTEEDVAWVQIALAAVVPSVKLSAYPKLGVMCPGTVDVIKGFQEYHSLPVDGTMDDRTWQLLVDSLESRRQKIEEREAKRAEAKLKAKMEAERKRQARQAESAKAMDMMEKTLYSLSSGGAAAAPAATPSAAAAASAGSGTPALHHSTSVAMPSQSPPSQPVQHSSPAVDPSAVVLPGTPPRQSAVAAAPGGGGSSSSSSGGVGSSQVPRSGSVPPTVSPWVTGAAPLSRTVSYTGTPTFDVSELFPAQCGWDTTATADSRRLPVLAKGLAAIVGDRLPAGQSAERESFTAG